jgi:hypothetical protein
VTGEGSAGKTTPATHLALPMAGSASGIVRCATAARMHTVHNARITLLANLLNTMAGSAFAIGVLTQLAAAFFYSAAPAGLRFGSIVIGIVFWLAASAVLHMFGRMVLGSLRQ